jgi:A118 family predicted phage portal protein
MLGVPLPADNTPWPPNSERPYQDDYAEADAWYSGDPTKLANFYQRTDTATAKQRRRRLWARTTANSDAHADRIAQRVHVPADLLFGEPPKIQIAEAHQAIAVHGAKDTEDRLVEIVDTTDLPSTLLEAAEISAGIGGVYLRPLWDPDVVDMPVLTVVHADRAVPEFRWGQLTAVTFWRTVLEDGQVVWRHLERHERGQPILHGLYAGTKDQLGLKRPLDSLTETASIGADDDGVVTLPPGIAGGIAVRYVPNALPNRRRRGSRVGRSDTAGTEGFMDALDDTMTSWIRDIRLGQGRIVVPSEFLDRAGRGQGATFDVDREVFTPLEMDPANQDKAGITIAQFEIRAEEHAATAAALFERIVVTAGYSPQTFGLHGDGDGQTATEVRARESRSLRTTGKKQRYFGTAVPDCLEMMLIIDREVFGHHHEVFRPRLEFAGGSRGPDHRPGRRRAWGVRGPRRWDRRAATLRRDRWDPAAGPLSQTPRGHHRVAPTSRSDEAPRAPPTPKEGRRDRYRLRRREVHRPRRGHGLRDLRRRRARRVRVRGHARLRGHGLGPSRTAHVVTALSRFDRDGHLTPADPRPRGRTILLAATACVVATAWVEGASPAQIGALFELGGRRPSGSSRRS